MRRLGVSIEKLPPRISEIIARGRRKGWHVATATPLGIRVVLLSCEAVDADGDGRVYAAAPARQAHEEMTQESQFYGAFFVFRNTEWETAAVKISNVALSFESSSILCAQGPKNHAVNRDLAKENRTYLLLPI